MIIRQLPATAVMTVDRLTLGDVLYGYTPTADAEVWRILAEPLTVGSVNPRFTYETAAVTTPDSPGDKLHTMPVGAYVLVEFTFSTYTRKGKRS